MAKDSTTSSVTLLGSGNAFNTDGRFSQSIFVQPPDAAPFLVDIGPTTLASMAQFGVSPEPIDRVFLTHLHGDHIAGWPFLMLDLLFIRHRSRPIDVYGPPGTRAVLTKLVELCYGELFARDPEPFTVRYHELAVEEGSGIDVGEGMSADTLPMDHHPTSIGYCFDIGHERLGISGDTCWCRGLEELGKRSTVLITECTTVENEAPGHLSAAELVARRGELAAPRIIVVHLCDAVAAALTKARLEGVVVGEDGMSLTL